MFISCRHCRELVAVDRDTGLPPIMCPRCGGILREPLDHEIPDPMTGSNDVAPVQVERSFVSFLRPGNDTRENAQVQELATASQTSPTIESSVIPAQEIEIPVEAPLDETKENHGDGEAVTAIDDASRAESETVVPEPGGLGQVQQEAGKLDHAELEPEEHGRVAAGIPDPETSRSIEASATARAEYFSPRPEPATPSFTRSPARAVVPRHTAAWQWAALVVLSMSLLLQVLIADRVRLSADAGWRPLITGVCRIARCVVPAWHQPGAFTMLARDVSPITQLPGGLNVQATFRNDARWSQPWPVLLLSLSDADGRVVGSRAFTPREYLGNSAMQTELAPGQSAQIALKLHEPNPDVAAFSFDFR